MSRSFAKVSPSAFWRGPGRKARMAGGLPALAAAMYLRTAPVSNAIGLFQIAVDYLAADLGLSLEDASKALRCLIEAGEVAFDSDTECIWIRDHLYEQFGPALKPNDKVVKGLQRELDQLPHTTLIEPFLARYAASHHLQPWRKKARPMEGPSKPLRSTETETETETLAAHQRAAKVSAVDNLKRRAPEANAGSATPGTTGHPKLQAKATNAVLNEEARRDQSAEAHAARLAAMAKFSPQLRVVKASRARSARADD